MNKKYIFLAIGMLLIAAVSYVAFRDGNSEPQIEQQVQDETQQQELPDEAPVQNVVSGGLDTPWEVAFLPGGDLLITERPGRLVRIDSKGEKKVLNDFNEVVERGESGLLGLALHPDFKINNWIYVYLTTTSNSRQVNRVVRYVLKDNALTERTVVVDNIPGAPNHDGGRIAFGPDGYLYVTTGDAQNEQSAQDTKSLAGKILRVDENGKAPPDNPFGNEVYSYGHRNPQGLAWDDKGRMWSTEHGPSGVGSGYDELNLIESGANYGWPIIKGTETKEGMKTPIIQSGASETWAPASLAFANGKLYFGGLRGQTLYVVDQNNKLTRYFKNEFGRIRVAVSRKEDDEYYLYISTSNNDGRGNPKDGDDKIVKIRISGL
jgi:glucose/arabinose dehydrogenase